MVNEEEIIKKIKKLNPLKWIEEQDAKTAHKYAKKGLLESYNRYIQSVERLEKSKQEAKDGN